MSLSLREELSKQFDAAEESTAGEPPPEATTPAPEVDVGEPPPEATEPAPTPGARARDEAGRFTKGAKPPQKVETPAAPELDQAPQAEPPPEPARAPQSWKAAIREKFAALPPEVQAEVLRREREMTTGLQEAAEARKHFQAFREVVSPYEAMIRAEGADPMRAIGSLLQTAHALRTAPPAMKAQVVARLIRDYGVDIEALDSVLGGEAPQAGQQAPQAPYRDPRVDQLFAHIEQGRAQRQQEVQAKASAELAELSKLEFYEDVREDMADILEAAGRRGVTLSGRQAYDRAVRMNEELSGILQQREAAKAAATRNEATRKAKAASSSVNGAPATTQQPGTGGGSWREALDAAIDLHSR